MRSHERMSREEKRAIHDAIHKEMIKNKKRHIRFSRRIFLGLGATSVLIFLITNLAIGGIFTSFRYYHQKKSLEKISEKVIALVEGNELSQRDEYIENLIYENIYIKVSNNDETLFDTYSRYVNIYGTKDKFLSSIELQLETSGGHKVYIVKNMQNEKGFLFQFVMVMMFVNFLSIFIIMGISKVLTFRILLPINKIIDTAEKISSENLSQRIEIFHTNDELSRLSTGINNMIDRLEKSFILQKKFVSDASHELRTPLQIIKGYTDLLLSKEFSDRKVTNEYLSYIKEEADNMIKLTESLLFIAKSENNNRKLQLEMVSVSAMLGKIEQDVKLIKPEIEFSIAGEENFEIVVDKELMTQAFRALIDNAIKYSRESNKIELRYYDDNNRFNIEIQDYGIGIEEKDIKNVFERFYRADESRSKETKGAGLGLSIVKNIVELHKGIIGIDSELGVGTKVKISIPLDLGKIEY